MKMQSTFGIFDDEADHIIELVRAHAPLEQICETPCPSCGSTITIEFTDDGTGFSIHCHGIIPHISKHQEINDPPPWWHECVIEPTDSTLYWREWHSFDDSGNLTMKVSGYDADGSHWTGQMECPTDHPDYAFWQWVLFESGCTSELIDDDEEADLRVRFNNLT